AAFVERARVLCETVACSRSARTDCVCAADAECREACSREAAFTGECELAAKASAITKKIASGRSRDKCASAFSSSREAGFNMGQVFRGGGEPPELLQSTVTLPSEPVLIRVLPLLLLWKAVDSPNNRARQIHVAQIGR